MEPCTCHTWKHFQYNIGIRAETRQRINAVHFSRGIYLPIYYLFKVLFVFLHRTCLRIVIPPNCFSILSTFQAFYQFFKTLRSKTILQSMRKFPGAVTLQVWVNFLILTKNGLFFLKIAHWLGLNVLDNYLFGRSKNLKTYLHCKQQLFIHLLCESLESTRPKGFF